LAKGQKYNFNETHKYIDEILYKKCMKHTEYFPEEDEWLLCNSDYFYKNKSNKSDGLCPTCKRCDVVKNLEKYYNDGGITKERTIKAASIRYHTVPSDKEIKLKNGIRQRETGYQAKWLRSKVGKERNRIYQIYRTQHKTHEISKTEWEACKKYFNYECAYCGLSEDLHFCGYRDVMKLMSLHKEHVDHTGDNALGNCVPACKRCNSSKHTDSFEEWYFKQDFYNKEKYEKIIKWTKEDFVKYSDCIINSKIT
jgi:hypothetical protein